MNTTTRAQQAMAYYNLYLSYIAVLFDNGETIPTYQEWKQEMIDGWGCSF